jgi:hypothetical protein
MATKKTAGRPTSLTTDAQERILEAIKAGNYNETAAKYAGIAVSTFYGWMERGRRERDRIAALGGEPDAKEVTFLDFMEAVEKAEAESEVRDVAIIARAAATGTWQAAAWRLERKHPRKYGRFDRSEVSGPEGGPVRIDVSTEDLERKINRILESRTTE